VAVLWRRASFLRCILASSFLNTSGLKASRYLNRCQRIRASLCAIVVIALGAQMAAEHKAARAGLIDHPQLNAGRRELFEELVHGVERTVDDAVAPDFRAVGGRDGDGDGFFVDVQSEVMHCFVHGCLVRFIDDDSGAEHASHIADRSALADNPRTRIKHPLRSHAKP